MEITVYSEEGYFIFSDDQTNDANQGIIVDNQNAGQSIRPIFDEDARRFTLTGTQDEINDAFPKIFWVGEGGENDVTITIVSEDFGQVGDNECEITATSDRKNIFLSYSTSDSLNYALIAGVASGAVALGALLAAAAAAGGYKALRATKVVDGVEAVKFDDALFSNTVDNPLYDQQTSPTIFEGAL
jgi:hypothetical protein